MKRILITSILGVILGLTACQGKKDSHEGHDLSKNEMAKPAVEEKLVYYTCPMESHKHVHSQEPGNCPECGMKMVQAVMTPVETADYYGCPMPDHSHVRSDKPGNCNECGMELKPMRLQQG
ncbi:MAG: hypothetical protein IIB95_08090 [Candidatus Marinimicrobia bacterium]|nr:hypothetical protein [Candidatus Neomarinimicrobiota bacterium]MCH7763687.1 hypothetical protein [Candidatus Neomarinimicrobiota bacterium]